MGTGHTLKAETIHSLSKKKQIVWDRVESEALSSEEAGYFIFGGLAQMPVAQSISSSCQLSPWDVPHYKHDVPGSTSDPDFPGTSLNEIIPTPACLKHLDCGDIFRKKEGPIYRLGEVPTSSQLPPHLGLQGDRWACLHGGCVEETGMVSIRIHCS